MKSISKASSTIRESFWLFPATFVCGAFVLAVGMTEVDEAIAHRVLMQWPWLFAAGADGSRSMLSAIASSMLTVATVTFSITMLALSQASSQYSPRVLRSFMKDRTTQTVLGVFLGVFVYCLVILRTITGSEENRFLPSMSVTLAGILAVAAIGFWVYFIHHIAISLTASNIIAVVGEETLQSIDGLFPEQLAPELTEEAGDEDDGGTFDGIAAEIKAPGTGYLNSLEVADLIKESERQSRTVRITACAGDFVGAGETVGKVYGAGSLPEEAQRKLTNAFVLNRHRSIQQDPAFGIQQLVDIALRALSPGVNDPTTAVMSIEYISVILGRLAERRIQPKRYYKQDGRLGVYVPVPSFAEFSELSFKATRSATQNPRVLCKIAASIGRVAQHTASRVRHAQLAGVLAQLTMAPSCITEAGDKAALEHAICSARSVLNRGALTR